MKKIANIGIAAAVLLLASCGAATPKEEKPGSGDKKAQLEQLKLQQTKLNDDIEKLEGEIAKTDPASVKKEKTKLVAVDTLATSNFTHYIDLQGRIDALNIATVTPRNGSGGQVKEVYVKQGDLVKKGQLLLRLDDAVLQRQLEQAQTQL